jgi:cytochrome b561
MVAIDVSASPSYSLSARTLHWLTLALLVILYGIAWTTDFFDKPTVGAMFDIHKAVGVIVIVITLSRLAYRLGVGAPDLPVDLAPLHKLGARLVQFLLYLALVVQPLSGILGVMYFGKSVPFFGLFQIPAIVAPDRDMGKLMFDVIHGTNAWILLGLIGIHAAGALYHHFIRRDDVLRTMLGTAR